MLCLTQNFVKEDCGSALTTQAPHKSRNLSDPLPAHSSDGILLAGGTLAHYALGGVEVALLCLTHGENGHREAAIVNERYFLPRARKAELARSSIILGAHLLSLLDFSDGKLTEAGIPRPAAYVANDRL